MAKVGTDLAHRAPSFQAQAEIVNREEIAPGVEFLGQARGRSIPDCPRAATRTSIFAACRFRNFPQDQCDRANRRTARANQYRNAGERGSLTGNSLQRVGSSHWGRQSEQEAPALKAASRIPRSVPFRSRPPESQARSRSTRGKRHSRCDRPMERTPAPQASRFPDVLE